MQKQLFLITFLSIINFYYSQIDRQYKFNIYRLNDSVRIESCIPLDLYNELLTIPGQTNNNKQIIQGIPMHVIGSKWVNNCLIINWPNISNQEIVGYLLEFTQLRKEQIIIEE